MRKLNCFIACAFGKTDVDNIYTKCIKKVLKESKINPIRVDKIDFVGKVDTKIISLIKKCDFCIADLTYARPSVYYEAGFTEGLNKKVIYTVHNSHFNSKNDDIYGNFKVHFDKVTDNIIGWKNPNNNFMNKLKRMIKNVIEPILENLRNQEKNIIEQNKFNNIPLTDRISKINTISRRFIVNKYYSHIRTYKDNIFFKKNNQNKYIWLITKSTITKRELESYAPFSQKYHFPLIDQITSEFKFPKNSNLIVILNNLRKMNNSTIEAVLSNFKKVDGRINKEYKYGKYLSIEGLRYIFIDNIKSESDYENKLIAVKYL